MHFNFTLATKASERYNGGVYLNDVADSKMAGQRYFESIFTSSGDQLCA
jgi:hypothetical protein